MKRLLCLVAMTAVAHADTVKPPSGWSTDPALAVKLSKEGGALPHFGGQRSIVTTEVFETTKGALYVHRISASIAGSDAAARDRAASSELSELALAAKRSGAAVDQQKLDAGAANLLEGVLRWHDDSTGVVSMHRMIVAADEQQMVAVHGECVLTKESSADVRDACTTALATLDPGIAPDRRTKLSIVAIAEPAPPPAPAGSAKSAPSLVESGERPSLPPMAIPQDQKEPDRRPIYVGLGLIVLAMIFYWNRKNREKLERDYEARTADKPEKPAKADRDADDLHAAADDAKDGDTKESEKS